VRHTLDYIVRKFFLSLLTLCAILVFNFFLFRVIPGDPVQMLINPRMKSETVEIIRQSFGLDKPVWLNISEARSSGRWYAIFDSQFFYYLGNLAHGQLGISFHYQTPVTDLIGGRLGPTLLLVVAGEITGILFGTVLGLVAAWKKRSSFDAVAMFISLTLWAMPAFLLGIVLLASAKGHLPMGGMLTPGVTYHGIWEQARDLASHLILPAITLALLLFGGYTFIVRNSALEVLAEDYILTAKAKGLKPWRILRDHALKNSSLPLVTIIALDLGYAIGGTIQIETIFSWPGIGRLMFESIGQRDYPVLQGVFLLLAAGVIGANFLADLIYAALDPRISS
jgi:peptide/nickel transport system permease protein